MVAVSGMNLISRIIVGALAIAVCAVVWYLLTQRNSAKGGCSGNCAGCSERCGNRKEK